MAQQVPVCTGLNSVPATHSDSSQTLVSNSSSRDADSSDLCRQLHARTCPQLKIVKIFFTKMDRMK